MNDRKAMKKIFDKSLSGINLLRNIELAKLIESTGEAIRDYEYNLLSFTEGYKAAKKVYNK